MDYFKFFALLLILTLSVSSNSPVAIACGTCPSPKSPGGPIIKPPITLPPIIGKPPITLPPIIGKPPITGKPPVTLPPVTGNPPVTLPPITGNPPVTLPPVTGKPPVTLPPVTGNPPVTLPPVTGTPSVNPGCSPPPETCPVDTLKLGACLDILGNVVRIGDSTGNECCPIIQGLAGLEAAACLCTVIKYNLLNINLLFPIALQLLYTCGLTPPPGYTCP